MAESKNANREISSTRTFNAPRDLVWKMWSEPEHLARWWGPRGFRNTIYKHEFRPGGQWSFIMHGPDGTDYPNEIVYVEISNPERLMLDHVSLPKFRITAKFEALSEKRTRVDFRGLFESAEVCESVKNFAILGNEENFDRMDAEMAKITGAVLPKEFVISRAFNAPVDLMWRMWTEPEYLAKWFGPKEVKVGRMTMDFRRGGTYHCSMVAPDGAEMWGKFYYRDIVKNKRVMYVSTFSNEDGGITRHPMAPQWPLEMLTTVNFEEKAGHTIVTIRWYPINATETEIQCFNSAHEGMNHGWGGSLDRLASFVE